VRVDKVIAINTVCHFFGPPCRAYYKRPHSSRYLRNDAALIEKLNYQFQLLFRGRNPSTVIGSYA